VKFNKNAVYFVLVFSFMLTACGNNSSVEDRLDFHSTSSINAAAHTNLETLEDLIEASDHILFGKLMNSRPYDDYLEYDVQVNEQLKGQVSNPHITVYSAEPFTKEHNDYLLFLTSVDSEFQADVVYTVIGVPNAIQDGMVESGPLKNKEVNMLVKDINQSPKIKIFKENKHTVIQNPKDMHDLVAKSDYIAHLKPTAINFENPSLKLVSYDLITLYKGDERLLQKEYMKLPRQIELNEEYLVFFRLRDPSNDSENPSISLTTRNGSVISKQDSQQWEEAIAAIENAK